jgi:phage shock protein C
MTAHAPATRLYRSTRDKKIAGVCGGIAEAMGWDPTAVRLLVVFSVLLPGPQFIAYLVAWMIMPTDREMATWAPVPPPPPMSDGAAAAQPVGPASWSA